MKTKSSIIQQAARGVSWRTATEPRPGTQIAGQNSIVIDGRTFTPDPDTAYVEFRVAHAFPVTTEYRTGIHPQVVANSYRTMVNKVFNLAHIMRKYDPKNNPRDRILGSIVAVEFPQGPNGITCKCGCAFQWSEQPEVKMGSVKCPDCELTYPQPTWTVSASRDSAPGIRVVAVVHKAAMDADFLIKKWFEDEQAGWMVSMENQFDLEDSGFIVRGNAGLDEFVAGTPADLAALGYTYVPCLTAPLALLECLNNDADDQREGQTSTRVCRDYREQETQLLLNGLNGTMRFRGVGLCPAGMAVGREPEAIVTTMLAAGQGFNLDRVGAAFDDFGKKLFGEK